MTGRAGRAAGALLLAAVLAGCGGQGGEDVGSSAGGGPASEPAAASPPPPTSTDELPEPLPPPPRGVDGDVQTLSGTVVRGVEARCLLLAGPGGDHLLLGGDPSVVRVGARVTVVGRADPTLLTTCQQGVPFRVQSATADSPPAGPHTSP